MKTKIFEFEFGVLTLQEKENGHYEDGFVGDIRLSFTPNFPTGKDGAELKFHSIDYPGHNPYHKVDYYEWLMSWYKDGRLIEERRDEK